MQKFAKKFPFRISLLAGVVAGALDATGAIIHYYIATGQNPVLVFKFIASGVFGKEAYSGSQSMVIFGVIFHFLIAIIFSVFYFWIYPKMQFLHKNKLTSAVVYGVFVWLVMNLIVVPLSITHTLTFDIMKALPAAFILIVCIGMPVSFMAASFYQKNRLGGEKIYSHSNTLLLNLLL